MVSRTHPGLVKRLFELEVPEIFDGTVEIRSIAREAGSRTKMAVWSADENVDPIGACVGPVVQRVAAVVNELQGEKIDIIKYSEDPAEYIAAALAPADVVEVRLADEGKLCRVIVPDDQLSLAIGKEGQNARLAARLTGYKIDIKPVSRRVSKRILERRPIMQKPRKIPQRMCVGCRKSGTKRTCCGSSSTPEGQIVLDATGKKSGRGAYCPDPDPQCLKKRRKSRGLDRCWRSPSRRRL